MAGGASRSPNSTITGINVTPLVDITLVLLIVFMVTAKLIVTPPKAMNLDLPKAATGTDVQEILSVVLYANGQSEVNGVAIASDDAVLGLASGAKARSPDLRVVIQADGAVAHRRVMHVLDLLKLAGLAKVGFGVVPLPAASSAADGELR
jgi:biopolymer transport protein ExbD